MAIYSMDREERKAFRSANTYRAEIERAEQAKIAKEILKEIEQDAKLIEKTVEDTAKLVVDEVDRDLNRRQDRQAQEIYKNVQSSTNLMTGVGSTMAGLTLIVASCAAEAVYHSTLRDAQRENEKNYHNDVDRRIDSATQSHEQTLASYMQRLEDTRQDLEANKTAAGLEYREKKDVAQSIINQANEAYDKEKSNLTKEERRSDAVYRKENDAIQKQYDSDVRRIHSEFPVGADRDRELQNAIERRDTRQSVAAQKHSEEIANIKSRVDIAETKRNDIVNRQNEIVATAFDKYKSDTAEARLANTNAQNKLAQFQNDYKATLGETVARAMSESSQYNKVAGGSRSNTAFVNAVQHNHNQIGHDLAIKLGKPADVDLIKRVDADLAAEKKAKATGAVHVPTTTAAERNEAKAIIQSHAGNIKSEKGIQSTITQHSKALDALSKESASLQKSINKQTVVLNSLNVQIQKEQSALKQISADKLALKTNRGADGVKLTDEQRMKIKTRLNDLEKNGTTADRAKIISELVKKKNETTNGIGKLKNDLAANQNLAAGVKAHINLLKKDGKAIATAITNKNKGIALGLIHVVGPRGSAQARSMQNKGTGLILRSVDKIVNSWSKELSKGNAISREMSKTVNSMAKVAKHYNKALNIAGFAAKGLLLPAGLMVKSGKMTLKVIGNHTRLGQALKAKQLARAAKWAEFATNRPGLAKAGKITGKIVVGAGKGTVGLSKKLAKTAIRAPGAILSVPQKLKNLPQTMARGLTNGAIRLTRKTVGVVGAGTTRLAKGTVRLVGKGVRFGINHTIGKTKWYQKVSGKFKRFGARIKGATQGVRKVLGFLNPVTWIKKFLHLIVGFFGTILTSLLSVIGFAAGMLLLLILLIVLIVVVLALLMSIIAAITNWLKNQTAEEKALVKNNPEYIVNQAVNYRNAELDIIELVYQFKQKNVKIEVNEAPIFYELYEDKSFIYQSVKLIFRWTGWIRTEEKLNNDNDGAKALYNTLSNRFEFNKTYIDDDGNRHNITGDWFNTPLSKQWTSDVEKYETFKLSYYPLSELIPIGDNFKTEVRGGQEQYVLRKNAQASDYELSNARDALAMVDALYTSKEKDMQRLEVLAYLGVGSSQLALPAEDQNIRIADNLFWATHKFVYKSGNESQDIWFHVTSENETKSSDGDVTTLTYKINSNSKYGANGKEPTTGKTCDNYDVLKFKEEKKVEVTETVDDYGWIYGPYKEKTYYISPYERHSQKNCPRMDKYGRWKYGVVYCDHYNSYALYTQTKSWGVVGSHEETSYETKTTNVNFYICKGHIDLDVGLVVTTMEDGDYIFEEAMKVKGLEQDVEAPKINEFFTFDPQQDVIGLGTLVQKAFHPAEDWEENSVARQLAEVKADVTHIYQLSKNQSSDKVKIDINHYNKSDSFDSIQLTTDRELLLGSCFCGQVYYVDSYISGEQKDLVSYRKVGGAYEKDSLISFAIATSTGTPYTIYKALPSEE